MPLKTVAPRSLPALPLLAAPFLAVTLLAAAVVMPGIANAQVPGETHERELAGIDVLISLPDDYAAGGEPSPLVLFLHGGDRSNTRHHPARYAEQVGLVFPFVVVAPHCASGCNWSRVDFDAMLEAVATEFNVDRTRIYLTGYSMGGYGSWDLLSRSPDWFAAAAPIAGGGDASRICAAREVPIRVFHGDADRVIPLSASQEMTAALEACGGNVEMKVLRGVEHGSWIPTFRDPGFWRWFLEHRRSQ